MGLANRLLSRSNSFQFYKKNYDKLKKENKALKKEIKAKDKKIKKLNKNLKSKKASKKGVAELTVTINNLNLSETSTPNPFQERLLTKDDFDKVLQEDKYYEKRWDYHKEVIDVLSLFDDVESVLEIGPYKIPFVQGSDIMDLKEDYVKYYPLQINEFIKHDGSQVPYPVSDKKYDLIVACQVIEHLGIKGEQKDIFNEFERISKRLLLTLPYKW